LPPIALVCRRVARASHDDRLAFPLFLWLIAAATFGMPVSNDYNLVSLPLAALAVFGGGRRDGLAVSIALALLLSWWQPLMLPISGQLIFVIKLAALYAIGASLAARAQECAVAAKGAAAVSARAAGHHLARSGSSSPRSPAQSRS
jgi:hypothetical protein